ncbi:MAG: hypothetical protein U7126_21210 [Microcoleus sp.]
MQRRRVTARKNRKKPGFFGFRYPRVRRHQQSTWEPKKSDSDAPYKADAHKKARDTYPQLET